MSWVLFFIIIISLIYFDLCIAHKKGEHVSLRKSASLSILYITVGVSFSFWIAHIRGHQGFYDYLTSYFVEKSLSIDNIFVMSLIFTSFKVPPNNQHKVLFWGILGAIVFRALMIGLGLEMIMHVQWILYVFGAFLIITGLKLLCSSPDHDPSILDSTVYLFLKRHMRLTHQLNGEKFWIKMGTKWHATPLLSALIMIEAADLVFAVDSVPAVLAITTDPYIVYTSNIFAILGLRSLYLLMGSFMERFIYLKYALSFILIFVGGKIFTSLLGYHVPSPISLGVICLAITLGIVMSLYMTRKSQPPSL